MGALRILDIGPAPFHHIPFLSAARGGGTETRRLPLLRGRAAGIPADCAALLVTSDLQGVARSGYDQGASALLGQIVVEHLEGLAADGAIPPTGSIGVVLAGDLYASPQADQRGASGEVSAVWRAFARGFRWVVGVAGNHDDFGTHRQRQRLMSEPGLHLLDGTVVAIDGLRVGGVGLVAGDPSRRGRRYPSAQLDLIGEVLARAPDLLVLHEGPGGGSHQPGRIQIRELLNAVATPPLTVCGHTHWDEPLATSGVAQVLNVDSRAVLLMP